MSFFDTTPTGRIIDRFAKDQEEVDSALALYMDPFLQYSFMVVFTFATISGVFPPMLVAVVVIGALFGLILLWVYTNFKHDTIDSMDTFAAPADCTQVYFFLGGGVTIT